MPSGLFLLYSSRGSGEGEIVTKLGAILDQIDPGSVLLPEFQRGYVRNRDPVRGLAISPHSPVAGRAPAPGRPKCSKNRRDGGI